MKLFDSKFFSFLIVSIIAISLYGNDKKELCVDRLRSAPIVTELSPNDDTYIRNSHKEFVMVFNQDIDVDATKTIIFGEEENGNSGSNVYNLVGNVPSSQSEVQFQIDPDGDNSFDKVKFTLHGDATLIADSDGKIKIYIGNDVISDEDSNYYSGTLNDSWVLNEKLGPILENQSIEPNELDVDHTITEINFTFDEGVTASDSEGLMEIKEMNGADNPVVFKIDLSNTDNDIPADAGFATGNNGEGSFEMQFNSFALSDDTTYKILVTSNALYNSSAENIEKIEFYFSTGATLSIKNNSKEIFLVYPNPIQYDQLYLDGYNGDVQIIDSTGRVIKNEAVINGTLSIVDIPSGNYILKYTVNSDSYLVRFVK